MRPVPISVLAILTALAIAQPAMAQDETGGEADCRYTVSLLDPAPRRLSVALECDGNGPYRLRGWRRVPNDHVENFRGGDGTELAREADAWRLTGTTDRVGARYEFDIAGLTETTNSFTIARYLGGTLVTSPTSFLLAPEHRGLRIAIRFETPEGVSVSTPFRRAGDWHYFMTDDFVRTGYIVMGHYARRLLTLPGPGSLAPPDRRPEGVVPEATVELVVADAPMDLSHDALADWVRAFAMETARYWWGFPVERAMILLRPVAGAGGLMRGHVLGGGGISLILHIGRHSDRAQLDGHWMLTHELAHFGSPNIAGGHRWLSEGMAVYVEALVRARGGHLDPARLWRGWLENLPRGVPTLVEGGLARARGVRAVYWGGALTMMLADVEIRRRTGNRYSLDDCLRGVLWAGGDGSAQWTLDRFVAACDAATGVPVMARMMRRYLDGGSALELAELWRRLGVRLEDGRAVFDNGAPLAHIRAAQTRPDGR